MAKKTLVIGASLKPTRYSNMAIKRLVANDIEVVAIGLRVGISHGVNIGKLISKEALEQVRFENIHTVTLYINPTQQVDYYDFIINLNPTRVVFNPGTENDVFYELLRKNKINYEASCTLVLLSTKQY